MENVCKSSMGRKQSMLICKIADCPHQKNYDIGPFITDLILFWHSGVNTKITLSGAEVVGSCYPLEEEVWVDS